ncbi:unnamed protein product [Cylindrotheca closterium]|uniref:Calmodulin-lysine N-methyltransferase n=1 Tax=Cylindrotheca closterium TaxID=2856 RepID=A0AAD2CJ93_9STRA|nr:unnamed protein product [Cylindrotheca closterium]
MTISTDNSSSSDPSSKFNDEPLPLETLKPWISSQEFVEWIQKGDEKQAALEAEMKENEVYNAANLFGSTLDEEFEQKGNRIQQWTSSAIHIDGIGGFDHHHKEDTRTIGGESSSSAAAAAATSNDTHVVQLEFFLSESYQGFGDTLWSSARYVANVLANPEQCQEILAPYLERRQERGNKGEDYSENRHPLLGTSVLEIGAGAGVPSWSAMHCGARVVCTDLADTNRIRSIAECACRNYRKMLEQEEQNNSSGGSDDDSERLHFAEQARACPHDWGSDVQPVLHALNHPSNKKEEATSQPASDEMELFDVVLAADCCYMPWTHDEMLDSIYKVMSPIGVALICFALHDNTDDNDVWKIVDRAKNRGFVVETLPSTQLTPPTTHMEAKQGLVHTVRLSKPQ